MNQELEGGTTVRAVREPCGDTVACPDVRVKYLGGDGDWRLDIPDAGPYMVYQLEGHGDYHVAGRVARAKKGDAVVWRGEPASGKGGDSFLLVRLPESVLASAPPMFGGGEPFGVLHVVVPERERANFESMFVVLFREFEGSLPGRASSLRATLLTILTFLYRIQQDALPFWTHCDSVTALMHRKRVQQVIHYIESHYHEEPSLADLAAMAGLNRTTFCEIFKSLVGMPPRMWLLHVRIREAQRLLARSDNPVPDIATRVGFNDISAFYRAFRQRTGTTPLAFRRGERMQAPSSAG